MTFKEQLSLTLRIHSLIKRRATGTPEQLARRLNVSRATVFRKINELKSLDAPVLYCKNRQSYFYECQFELNLNAY